MGFEYKGYLTAKQQEEGNLTHGEVTSLPFGNPSNGIAFSLMAVSKVAYSDEPVLNPALMIILDAKFIADESASPYPLCRQRATGDFNVYPQWTERNICLIPNTTNNQTILTSYRLFWKAGKTSPAS